MSKPDVYGTNSCQPAQFDCYYWSICLQAHDERNYHIFYCMIQGLSADQLNQLELKDATSYYYLTQVYQTVLTNFSQGELLASHKL